MSIFYEPDISSGADFLNEEESRHCVKVLRKKVGDKIKIIDGKGGRYLVEIIKADAKKCVFSILEETHENPNDFYIHIAIAPTKNSDRLEWFVEKAVEIGIDEISFVLCDNSERRNVNQDRILKKVISAAKQSLKAKIPVINTLTPLKPFLQDCRNNNKYIAHVDFSNPTTLFKSASSSDNYCVLIGPEGDFSKEEVDLALQFDFQKVSLGASRLRTETAGLAACHSLHLIQY